MKVIRTFAAMALLLSAATPSRAIVVLCDDICTCNSSCRQTCHNTPSTWSTCGATGDCAGGANCVLALPAQVAQAASAVPQVCKAPADPAPAAAPSR